MEKKRMLVPYLLILEGLLFLAGCQRVDNPASSLKKTPDLEEDSAPVQMRCTRENRTLDYGAQGDRLVQSVQIFTLPLDALGISADLPVEVQQERALQAIDGLYAGLEGVESSAVMEEGQIRVEVSIYFDKANLEQLIAHGLMSNAEVQNRYVSLEKTRSALESAGYACTADGGQS